MGITVCETEKAELYPIFFFSYTSFAQRSKKRDHSIPDSSTLPFQWSRHFAPWHFNF